jgi:pimeloyl-ACP methyl ester carboxylesterase
LAAHNAAPPLFVDDTGTGGPVLLLHSSGMSGRQWKRLASSLVAKGRRAIVPDLAGHGRSEPWPEPKPFSYATDVASVLALVRAIDEPVDLVGHSYGGLVALLVGLAAPARVRSLAVYDPVAFGALDPTDEEAQRDLARLPPDWGTTAEHRDRWLASFVDYWGGDGAWTMLRDDARDEFRRVAWVLHEGVVTLATDTTPVSAYRAIDAPSLLMTGERTPVAARHVIRRLGEALPRSETVLVPKAGHMGPLTHGDVVNQAILDRIAT